MEIKRHFGVYGVYYRHGYFLCIQKIIGPYKNRLDFPGGSQQLVEGLTEPQVAISEVVSDGTSDSFGCVWKIIQEIISSLEDQSRIIRISRIGQDLLHELEGTLCKTNLPLVAKNLMKKFIHNYFIMLA